MAELDSVPYEAMASLLQRPSNSGEYTEEKLTAVLATTGRGSTRGQQQVLECHLYIVFHSHLNELEHRSGGTPKPVTWIVGGATEKHKTYRDKHYILHQQLKIHICPYGRNNLWLFFLFFLFFFLQNTRIYFEECSYHESQWGSTQYWTPFTFIVKTLFIFTFFFLYIY